MDLKEIRKEIDKIDNGIVELLKKRFDCSLAVADYKIKNGLPVLNSEREQQIIEEVTKNGGEHGNSIASVYREIMSVSRQRQHNLMQKESDLGQAILNAPSTLSDKGVIACQGTEGAFSHLVAKNLFKNGEIQFYENFESVFAAVESGEADFGVVPVENSNAGSVHEVYDLILKYRHFIVGAAVLKVNENLLGVKGSKLKDIKTVYSHSQALSQSEAFIKEHGFTPVQYANTALAAKFVAEKGDKTCAAIGSLEAAKSYGLTVLARNIQTVRVNSTRFVVISKKLIIPKNADKASVVFMLPHVTGSLYKILNRFALEGLNLTKIESHAARNGKFEYEFYLDFSGKVQESETVKLLCELGDELPDFTFLGNYSETDINNC